MTVATVTLEDLKERKLDQLLESVLSSREILTVRMPGGGEVVIRPKLDLQPLTVLDGNVPNGWKDAIYGSALSH